MKPSDVISKLRHQRRISELSQMAVANTFGVLPAQISDYERGNHSPTLDTLCKWVDALDCEIVIQPKAKP